VRPRDEPWPFVVVWRLALRESSELTTTQYAIAHTIATYMRPGGWTGPDRKDSPGRKAIADGAKLSLRAVAENLIPIAGAGLLQITNATGATHLYVATVPAGLADKLLSRRFVQQRDLDSCERLEAGLLAGKGVHLVHPSFSPLTEGVHVVHPEGGSTFTPPRNLVHPGVNLVHPK
jgi:hypothetical protein